MKISRDKPTYFPRTPAGTIVDWLDSKTFRGAISRLLKEAAHMPYGDWAGFYERGYRIVRISKKSEVVLDDKGRLLELLDQNAERPVATFQIRTDDGEVIEEFEAVKK